MFSFFKQLLSKERSFILCVMASIFLISWEYGVTRPASNSIFISAYSASWIPFAWIAALPLNFFATYLYNRFLPHFGCRKMFLFVLAFIITLNTIGAFAATSLPFFPFFQTICKDFYILLMFKQVWSLIHTTISSDRAKVLYGMIAGMGGLGSVLGGFLANRLAVPLGTQSLFFFTLPLYLLLFFFYSKALRNSKMNDPLQILQDKEVFPTKGGLSLIRNSRPLIFVLSIVVLMQLSTSLIDFQFNLSLEKAFPTTDLRTQYYGKAIGMINAITALFQLCGGFVLIHFLGLKKCHLFISLFLLCNGLLLFFVPAFAMVSYAFISIKAMDYSLFGIAREMLYIPMKIHEKFQAKAIIDVFAYRAARAVGSFFILFLQFFTGHLQPLLRLFSIVIFFCWFCLVWKLFKTETLPEANLPNDVVS